MGYPEVHGKGTRRAGTREGFLESDISAEFRMMSKKCCRDGQSRALTLTVGSKEATGHVTSRPGMVPTRLKGLEQGSVGVRTCLLGHVWCSAVEEGLL